MSMIGSSLPGPRARRRALALGAAAWSLAATIAVPMRAATVTVAVDAGAARHPISPYVYGVNFADPTRMSVVPYPLNRWGGNSTTRYNWKTDMHNTGSDWYFLNLENQSLNASQISQLPNGSDADNFLLGTTSHGGMPLLTVPTIGYVPKWKGLTVANARQRRWGFSISKYGAQNQNECVNGQGNAGWCQAPPAGDDEIDAGDGTCSGGTHCQFDSQVSANVITGNDPLDTSDTYDASFVTDWMAHIATRIGSSSATFYALDNEPGLWSSTHRDVHPAGVSYDELFNKDLTIAAAMKAANPNVKITGPVPWGWCEYITQTDDSCNPSGADITAHGGVWWVPYFLDQMHAYETAHGVRLVDYLDLHYYPQATCVDGLGWGPDQNNVWHDCNSSFSETGSSNYPTQTGTPSSVVDTIADVRLNALKELYVPTWHSQDWIGDPHQVGATIGLIPRMREWVADHYPGTKLAITEYRYGTDDGATSALAQAEALAIFGREGVDLATRWTAPASGTASEDAFRLYLDYDSGSPGFQQVMGDSVQATSGAPDTIGSYAVRSSGNQLFVLLFNHGTASNTASITFASAMVGPAVLWKFDPAAASSRISSAGTAALGGAGTTLSVPLAARTAMLAIVQIPAGLPFSDGFDDGKLDQWSTHD